MLVVDLLHEFELGVWKALFIHLLRILNAVDKALVHELDRRYALFHTGPPFAIPHISYDPKIQASSYLWERHYQAFLEQCL